MGLREILDNPRGGQSLSMVIGGVILVLILVSIAAHAWHLAMSHEPVVALRILRDGFWMVAVGSLIVRIAKLLRERHGSR